jgi:glutamyl-tRNA synthetase
VTDDVLGDLTPQAVRVRFPPSPTGLLHVGNIRSALFNWAFARHYGGKLVLRIEDTDIARNTEEGLAYTLLSLRWLGIDWDEGPEVGGSYGPYLQSERLDTYADIVARLLDAGRAYHCYCSQEELDQRREAARAKGLPSGYDGHCRTLTAGQVAAYRAEGRRPVVRLRMPDHATTFTDLVRGEITVQPENLGDYVLVRANGHPLYPLVNPVDDALMEITHVLRGEDLLPSTPRQIALYDALGDIGIRDGTAPRFGHLPMVMGEGNKRLSKRDGGSGLAEYMERGFLPEGLLNYLALLGWSIADDRDVFTTEEMIEKFDIRRVNANAARFDPKKCEAINAADAGPAGRPGGGRTADPGADEHAVRGGRHDRLPVRRRARLPGLAGRRGQGSDTGVAARAGLRGRRTDGGARLDHGEHREGAAARPGRGARDQAEERLRTGPGRGHRPAGVAAAVRVAGVARPGAHAAPDRTGQI